VKKKVLAMGLVCILIMAFAGCGKQQESGTKAVAVKTMHVIKRDTPLTYEYTGFVEAKNEVSIKSKVTGMIVKKFVNGGDVVAAGQLLYVIDPRSYANSLLSAKAGLANAEANLINVQRDAARYQTLYEQGAVSKQTLDSYTTQLAQAEATVNAEEALVANAQVDVGETNIVAPFAGKVDTNCLAEGTFVTAGSTVLTTISNSDPMRVKFSLAETEYLQLLKGNTKNGSALENVVLTLSDGTTYPLKGRIDQVDRSVDSTTGTLTLKAEFGNPKGTLLPGMFAHLQVNSGTRKNAILVPQRAVSEVMYKHFVSIVNSENKVEMKEVKLGARIGRLWMVDSGLDGTETIVVEGIQKVRTGTSVKTEPMTEADLETTSTTTTK
ncbi:MAG: efflux RND transporter periplasmic adaptor subunit, partial [Acidaminococcaceae bacterium]|nr:efflux RND transporter periplasmic adaptor subunit [Acidaminococcaceae bacterium]